jgi:predicted dinucleotide-binding enzyme
MTRRKTLSRRTFNTLLLAGTALGVLPGLRTRVVHAQEPLRIGIIGSGQIGGAIGKRWAEAGHQILFSSRNPDELAPLVAEAGPNAQAGSVAEAVQFGDIVLVAVPYGALPQVGADNAAALQGKIVIDCTNPRADRDGPMADEAIAKGTGVASAEFFRAPAWCGPSMR